MPPTPTSSSNFTFLREHEEALVLLAAQAETLFPIEAAASITKTRLFAELLTQEAAARVGIFTDREEKQIGLLRRPRSTDAGRSSDRTGAAERPERRSDALNERFRSRGVRLASAGRVARTSALGSWRTSSACGVASSRTLAQDGCRGPAP